MAQHFFLNLDSSKLASDVHVPMPEILVECRTCQDTFLSRYQLGGQATQDAHLCPACGVSSNLQHMTPNGMVWRYA